jgi:hypothetical protein
LNDFEESAVNGVFNAGMATFPGGAWVVTPSVSCLRLEESVPLIVLDSLKDGSLDRPKPLSG